MCWWLRVRSESGWRAVPGSFGGPACSRCARHPPRAVTSTSPRLARCELSSSPWSRQNTRPTWSSTWAVSRSLTHRPWGHGPHPQQAARVRRPHQRHQRHPRVLAATGLDVTFTLGAAGDASPDAAAGSQGHQPAQQLVPAAPGQREGSPVSDAGASDRAVSFAVSFTCVRPRALRCGPPP